MPRDDSSRLSRLKHNLKLRALVLDGIRDFFRSEGFLEVETPLNVEAVAPEQHIFPFTVEGRFLTTSPELHMKRLLADGYSKIFQICRCFRKGERGQLHNPEFTMLEWYRAGADYMGIVEDTERLVQSIAGKLHAGSTIRYQGVEINLERPWRRITVRQAFLDYAGWDPIRLRDPERFDTDFVEKVMPGFPLDEPTVLLDYPAEMASLSRLKPGHPEVAERAEVFIGGLEIANAYSELRDAVEQEQRFRHEIEIIKKE
ncbi:MAG: EF-P lysine aminoacylase GenX, partial [Chloroflexi bacterium]|nr:EF-P lysine aminoacylase GenX [Chloroflexota bacterium]